MQGRLTESKGRGIQFFPFENWENEFRMASKLGIGEIDFIFDLENYKSNPLWSGEGIEKIKSIISETGVVVNFICADFFMRRPFFRVAEEIRKGNIRILKQLIRMAKNIGAKGIEIPLVDNSSIKTGAEEDLLIKSLKECLPAAMLNNIVLNLETDLSPKKLLVLLKKLDHPLVKITYDSGNSSSLGYDPHEEISTYGQYITNVHIKDRVMGGGTVALGTGDADFAELFQGLKELEYTGHFILQAARGPEGQEENTIKSQIDFVKGCL